MSSPRALIITVNFRHAECTLQFLKSASAMHGFSDCHLVIVDNNSGDGSVERIQQAISGFSNVKLIASSSNLGYFGAAKWALNQHEARDGTPEWVIICNNDIVFDNPAFLSGLFSRDPNAAGVLAPAIISSLTGFDSNPMILSRPGRLRQLRYRFLVSAYFVAWLTQWLAPSVRKARQKISRSRTQRVDGRARIYAPHGSFLIFSRRFFTAGGFLDDGGFLYAEEIGVAETCRRLGIPVIHDPGLRVSHNDSQTTGRMLTRSGYQLQRQGLRYALGKYLEPSRGA